MSTQMMTPKLRIRRQPTFFACIYNGFFRRNNDVKGLVYYAEGKVYYPVLVTGEISRRSLKLNHISLGVLVDIIKPGEIGISEIRWTNERPKKGNRKRAGSKKYEWVTNSPNPPPKEVLFTGDQAG